MRYDASPYLDVGNGDAGFGVTMIVILLTQGEIWMSQDVRIRFCPDKINESSISLPRVVSRHDNPDHSNSGSN